MNNNWAITLVIVLFFCSYLRKSGEYINRVKIINLERDDYMAKKEEPKNVNTANYVITRVFADKPLKEIILKKLKNI